DLAESIAQTVCREFRNHFSALIDAPLLISARALAVERAKAEPDSAKLAETGYDLLIQTLEQLLESQERKARLCYTVTATLERAVAALTECSEGAEQQRDKVRSEVGALDAKLEDIGNVQLVLRRQIATLARARAMEICQRIARQAERFIDAQLD